MFKRTAELDKVLPHRSLRDKPPLLLKVLENKAGHTNSNTHTHEPKQRRKVASAQKREQMISDMNDSLTVVQPGTVWHVILFYYGGTYKQCLHLCVFMRYLSPVTLPESVNGTQIALLSVPIRTELRLTAA